MRTDVPAMVPTSEEKNRLFWTALTTAGHMVLVKVHAIAAGRQRVIGEDMVKSLQMISRVMVD